MSPIQLLPEARQDFDQSFDWYATRSDVAAERFTFAIEAGLARIAKDAAMLPHINPRHQYCPVSRFPFRIIFRVLHDHILIVAIAHAKRRPQYWKQRG
ncbi:MAG: type II toxin-antitoxin system RelE/ParE family toxin [Planctomycetaceae bacterium]|nr:type II toxin-antitoxin system RelE/ParE family toxin [Planctomycetaceae bacterium]